VIEVNSAGEASCTAGFSIGDRVRIIGGYIEPTRGSVGTVEYVDTYVGVRLDEILHDDDSPWPCNPDELEKLAR
jgi:hypothetical protein